VVLRRKNTSGHPNELHVMENYSSFVPSISILFLSQSSIDTFCHRKKKKKHRRMTKRPTNNNGSFENVVGCFRRTPI
jgi:hypothetical protein